MNNFYDIKAVNSRKEEVSMNAYKGKPLLIVNVASNCVFSKQYKLLEEIYQKYKGRGLNVLAFPSNDHGNQEPGSLDEIINFCHSNFNVSFEIFNKIHTVGIRRHPLFSWLVNHSEDQRDIKWNFEKFIISRDGKLVQRFESTVRPTNPKITSLIENLIKDNGAQKYDGRV
ncbi:glutathione peroxidase [Bacillus sp. 166amftsu]|uniref:glutathione peroxidase n=1 Tax=Bacillus sp. 166amftsu TaxID=1761753 RepID=UPI00089B715C|nr:glutathione peroxidase [Bacillus sp. 166amftsu]SDZ37932.1 glutathione peroxidase [Bacillus sp. 166amftsu]